MRLSAESYEQILAGLRSDSQGDRNKRREPRVGLGGEVEYVTVNDKGKRLAGTAKVRDVSASGVGLIIAVEMAAKQRFVLQLKTTAQEPLWLVCLTAYCRRIDGNIFSVGARLQQVLKADEVRKIESQAAAASAATATAATAAARVKARPVAAAGTSDIERISKAILG